MARVMVIFMLFWAFSFGAFWVLRGVPKTSPFYALRDFSQMFFWAVTVVAVLTLLALLTGVISLGDDGPFSGPVR